MYVYHNKKRLESQKQIQCRFKISPSWLHYWRRKWQPTRVLAWRIPGTGGAWWAAIYGVAQSWTRLKWLSSRLHYILNFLFCIGVQPINKQCNSFRWTVKGSSHTYTVVRSPPNSPPIQATPWQWAEFHVSYSRSLLAIYFKHSSERTLYF